MKREEAIKTIMSANVWTDEEREALGILIPELAESEDEKIRKSLAEYHKQQLEKNCDQEIGLFHKDAIAWLEKQKDLDKMIVVSPDVWDNAINDAYENGKRDGEKQKECVAVSSRTSADEDERIRKALVIMMKVPRKEIFEAQGITKEQALSYLEKQKEASKAIEAVEKIDKYINEHLANAHDMKDSNPDKKYYRGWDDALAKMSGILQDVYSGEKQKEQKPAEWKPQPESLEALMYAIEGKWEAIKPTSYLSRRLEDLYDGLVNTFNVDESFIAHENDYVSKSAEWSEEDEKNLELVTDCVYEFYPDPVMKYKLKDWLKFLPERFNLQPKNEWSEEDEKIRNAILGFLNPDKGGTKYSSNAELVWWSNWLKNLHGRFNPQPKAEWSENDEKKIHFLSRLIEFQVKDDEYCFGDGRLISKQEAIEMLKSFRPQQKQEWSEEDEEKINNISEIIEHCITIPYSGGTLKLSQEYKKELQCFLKSLRPSWKPSEEQMEAFKGYIEDFQARAEAAVGGWNNFDVMIRLFEQLNKLMQKG